MPQNYGHQKFEIQFSSGGISSFQFFPNCFIPVINTCPSFLSFLFIRSLTSESSLNPHILVDEGGRSCGWIGGLLVPPNYVLIPLCSQLYLLSGVIVNSDDDDDDDYDSYSVNDMCVFC